MRYLVIVITILQVIKALVVIPSVPSPLILTAAPALPSQDGVAFSSSSDNNTVKDKHNEQSATPYGTNNIHDTDSNDHYSNHLNLRDHVNIGNHRQ